MKKGEQREINIKVERVIERFNTMVLTKEAAKVSQLYTCNATVYDTYYYIVLQSNNITVALIDKADMYLYDFSRYVYGYTTTTAQHIAKFAKMYDIGQSNIYTWKEVR